MNRLSESATGVSMSELHVGAPAELAVTPSGGERVVLTGDVAGWEEHEKGITRIWVWLDPESRERSRALQKPIWAINFPKPDPPPGLIAIPMESNLIPKVGDQVWVSKVRPDGIARYRTTVRGIFGNWLLVDDPECSGSCTISSVDQQAGVITAQEDT